MDSLSFFLYGLQRNRRERRRNAAVSADDNDGVQGLLFAPPAAAAAGRSGWRGLTIWIAGMFVLLDKILLLLFFVAKSAY